MNEECIREMMLNSVKAHQLTQNLVTFYNSHDSACLHGAALEASDVWNAHKPLE